MQNYFLETKVLVFLIVWNQLREMAFPINVNG